MTPEHWQQVKQVFQSAIERPPDERAIFLAQACLDDSRLRSEVESLISAHDQAGDAIEAIAAEVASDVIADGEATSIVGRQIGHYKVLSHIGRGGMGEVFLAQDTRLGRKAALKLLRSEFTKDEDRLRRFRQEARAASALNHPNILTIYDIGRADSLQFMATEYVEGETLLQHIARAPISLGQVLDVAVQAAGALAAAHQAGITHRDVKPENIMLRTDGYVKVLDFGLAKLAEPRAGETSASTLPEVETASGVVMGTVNYMSPEQARGLSVDAQTDIWSLGVVLYEMVAGRQPFDAETSSDVIALILQKEPPPLVQYSPGAPDELERIVRKALRKDREERYQTAKDLLIDLRNLRKELELEAEMERSAPPASSKAMGSGQPAAATTHRTSSAEYLVSEIKQHKRAAALILGVIIILPAVWYLLLRSPRKPTDRSQWVQITNLSDAVSQPALSSDGRMLTFIRGPDTFAARGEIYVKMLPSGEAIQLTRDNSQKMSPVFSPDGSKIAYTVVGAQNHWDTWLTPVLAGLPRQWLPNASGLVWSDKGNILFSEIKNNIIHMGVVAAEESRAAERDVYVPSSERGMAHRSYPSPDGKWVLVVEMDRALWLPCRLVPMDGSSSGRQVGPPGAGCTSAAWSPDGKWMYLNSAAGGAFHIWRQRFPDGGPEQITSGPTEEEGIAMMPDGRSFITSVGLKQSSVWVHDSSGERQISLEGYAYDPKFTPDGKRLCYRTLKGASSLISGPSEVHVVELDSGRNEPLLPGFAVVKYDISSDGQRVVVSALDHEGKKRLWLTPLNRQSPPHQIPNVQGSQPLFAPDGEIFFNASEGTFNSLYRVHEDGTGLRKAIEPIASLLSISPDKQWVVVKLPGTEGVRATAFPLQGGSPVHITAGGGISSGDPTVQWSPEGRRIFISVPTAALPEYMGRTYVIPLPHGRALPQIPVGGFRLETEIAKLPGALLIDALGVTPGPTSEVYAFVRVTVQRNLFSVPLP
jgi:serine/threonine protein kinase